MIETFGNGGVMMWPLLLIGLAVVALTASMGWSALVRRDASHAGFAPKLRAIVFWGAVAATLGLLGTVVGIIQAARAITLAGEASPGLVWQGVAITLITFVFGLCILLFALVSWLALSRLQRREATQ
jgi:biopolymer transport protein ExbB/TolQ